MSSSTKIDSPFLNVPSFTAEVSDSIQEVRAVQSSAPANSPFLSVYELDEWTGPSDPDAEEHAAFLNEMYDEELDEALFELASEAASLAHSGLGQEREEPIETGFGVERMLRQHFEPLAREVEGLFDAVGRRWGENFAGSTSSSEIDSFLDGYVPQSELSPAFENFWGSIKKAVGNVAKKAVNLAKKGVQVVGKLALGPLFAKLKPLIRPLLEKVLRFAIGKLPPNLQPIATQLGQKLGFLKKVEDGASDPSASDPGASDSGASDTGGTDAAMPSVSEIQHEFNGRMANVLFARGEVEQDYEVAQAVRESQAGTDDSLAELDDARERFIQRLRRLRENEDPTPAVQEFLPAILPALRVGMKIIGRKRIVDFLAGLLGKLIQKFVGPQYAPALSKAMVDAGLRLVNLEASAEDEANAPATAVAATIEDTVRRVSALPEYVLDNRELLEASALEAFEQAATENLPAILPEETYRKRPELRETKTGGMWMPGRRGRLGRRWKKFSRALRTQITPQKAATVETFGGELLSDFLSEQLGLQPGDDVGAVVHLFETTEGSILPLAQEVADSAHAFGYRHASELLHPLTREAAGVLLGEPSLGRDVDPRYLASPFDTVVGQRLYYLEVPGKRPLSTPTPGGRPGARRRSHVKLVLDFPGNQIRLFLYASEIRAQNLAVKLRQKADAGKAVTSLQRLLKRGIRNALVRGNGRLKVIHEGVLPNQSAVALRKLPALVPQTLSRQLIEWVMTGLSGYFKQPQQFISATEDMADGVTLTLTMAGPPGMAQISQALKGKVVSVADFKFTDGAPTVNVQVKAGHSHE